MIVIGLNALLRSSVLTRDKHNFRYRSRMGFIKSTIIHAPEISMDLDRILPGYFNISGAGCAKNVKVLCLTTPPAKNTGHVFSKGANAHIGIYAKVGRMRE